MKIYNFIVSIYVLIFCVSLVSAEFIPTSITGRIVNKINNNISQMSGDELIAFYEANKGSISQNDFEDLYEINKNNLSKGVKEIYEQNKDLIIDKNIRTIPKNFNGENFSINEESLDIYLELLSCSLIKSIVDPEIFNFEIPEKIPFQNGIFNIYLDNKFLISLNLVDGRFQNVDCEANKRVTYNIYIKKKLILKTIEEKDDINFLNFYQENRKNGNFNIEPIGFTNKIKFGFINLGLKIASWFD